MRGNADTRAPRAASHTRAATGETEGHESAKRARSRAAETEDHDLAEHVWMRRFRRLTTFEPEEIGLYV